MKEAGGPPALGGNVVLVPKSPEEQCLEAVSSYLRHEGIGGNLGDIPLPVRQQWREISTLQPDIDTESAFHWAWMSLELGVAGLRYREEPDNTSDAINKAFQESFGIFKVLSEDARLSRFDRARAGLAANAADVFISIFEGNPRRTIEGFCEVSAAALKDAVAWYGRSGDPRVRKYVNSLAAMTMINMGFASDPNRLLLATPSPSRHEEGLADVDFSDTGFLIWTNGRYMHARAGQRASMGTFFDPLLLSNGDYRHTAGHSLGAAQAIIDAYGKSAHRGETTRKQYIGHVQAKIRKNVLHNLKGEGLELPDISEGPNEWYGAHLPGMPVQDYKTLDTCIETLGPKQRELPSRGIATLAGMYLESRLAQGGGQRTMVAARLFERAMEGYQQTGEVAKSYEMAIAAAATPVYAAIAEKSSQIDESIAEYRGYLLGVAQDLLAWRAEPMDDSNAAHLDRILQEVTISLLLLADPAGGHVPLPSLPRERGEYMDNGSAVRHWHISVSTKNVEGTFPLHKMARLRLGSKANDASLDEAVYTVTPSLLAAKPGSHPLLQAFITEGQGGTFPPQLARARQRAFSNIEQNLVVADLI